MLPVPYFHQLSASVFALVAVLSGNASRSPKAEQVRPAPDDTVNAALYNGWKQYVLLCERCHGEDAKGTTFAPSLLASLRPDGAIPTEARFIALLTEGRTAKGMPPASTLGLDPKYYSGMYQYLKGRSDGVLHGGRPVLREP